MVDLYSKSKVAELLGITPRTVSHYTEMGLVKPEVNSEGTGRNRKYSKENLFDILLVIELQKHGFNLETIKQIIRSVFIRWGFVREGNIVPSAIIIYDGHTDTGSMSHKALEDDGSLKVNMKDHLSATVIMISDLKEKIRKALE